MDTSLHSVSTLEWIAAAVVGLLLLLLILFVTAPFFNPSKKKDE